MKLVNRLSNIQMRIGNYKKSKNQELVFYSQRSCNDTTLHFLSKSMHVTKIADIIEYNTFCANSGLLSFPESKKAFRTRICFVSIICGRDACY